jgi:hypothetical protein
MLLTYPPLKHCWLLSSHLMPTRMLTSPYSRGQEEHSVQAQSGWSHRRKLTIGFNRLAFSCGQSLQIGTRAKGTCRTREYGDIRVVVGIK